MDNNRSSASKAAPSSASKTSPPDSKAQPPPRPLYSSKLGDAKAKSDNVNSSLSPTARQPPVAQKAWGSAKNPITGRSSPQTPPNNFGPSAVNNSKTASLREGQRARITLNSGAEFEGIYANNQADPSSFFLRMVQRRNGDMANGTTKREQATMTFARKDISDARHMGGKSDAKINGSNSRTASGFRTDSAISNNRQSGERVLQPWVPDSSIEADGSLEKGNNGHGVGKWDQFAENQRLFGLETNYDENIYTTAIDKSAPNYKERLAAADRKAREIERSVPTTAHVAEERIMDYVGGGGDDKKGDEEDKYSGVRRQETPLQGRENKYTPPARRAPAGAGQATSYGAPVDPAIISSQLKGAPSKKPATPKTDEVKGNANGPTKPPSKPPTPQQAVDAKASEAKPAENKAQKDTKATEAKAAEKPAAAETKAPASLRPAAAGAAARVVSPQNKPATPSAAAPAPSATSTVEVDVLKEFRNFAHQQRAQAEKVRASKAKADNHVKLQELKKFADSFKLSTPVPSDLISIIAKDPAKQKAIQEKALQNAVEIAKTKSTKVKESTPPAKEPAAKPAKEQPAAAPAPASQATPDTRNASRSGAPQHTPSPANQGQRHQGNRQSYAPPGGYNNNNNNGSFRNDRSSQYGPPNRQPGGGTLSQRLRQVEQDRHGRPPMGMNHGGHDPQRQPPTGPANAMNYPRMGQMPQMHMAPKLNPNSNEFRPNAFAPAFNPNGVGPAGPPGVTNNVAESAAVPVSVPTPAGPPIRRKTKAVDVKKCNILAHIKTIKPPVGRSWAENEDLPPSYDTLPTWRTLKEDEPEDSTMLLSYSEYLEKMPFASGAMATPNPPHVMPMAHQHQLPFHLQHGAHNLAPRHSPHMPPMPMPGAQHGHMPHGSFAGDDNHRMMHSNSAQSFASPRIPQVPIGYPPSMGSPAQIPYQQGMPPFMPSTPQMNNYRSFSNNPQYMPQQNSPMTVPLLPSQFMPAPNQMGGPQMIYAGGHQQFVPGGGAAPQPIPGANGGFPSPGRPAAAMMAQQGSQQGQPMYAASPSMQFQQPVFPGGHPGHMSMRGGYNGAGPQQYGSSPQMHQHQYNNQHRNNSYGGGHKNYQGHGHHQGGQQGHQIPSGPQGRQPDGPEEGK